jgi:nitrogen regulatory protein P-II 1
MQFQLIVVLVKPHISDPVVNAVKKSGGTGATIIPARGTGVHEAKSFFGLSIEDRTDVLLFLVEEHCVPKLLETIRTAGRFDQPGTGIAFVLPVSQVAGLESQLPKFKDFIEKQG